MLKITAFLLNYRKALPFSDTVPACFWRAESDRGENRQRSFRLTAEAEGEIVYDTGTVLSSSQEARPDFPLKPRTRYLFRAEITDRYGETAAGEAFFETGKLNEPWTAEWIASGRERDDDAEAPVYLFRRVYRFRDKPVSARLCLSALGLYSARVNGVRTDSAYFSPGYTQYTDRVPYDCRDVTALCEKETEIRIELAGGWYTGRLGISLQGNRYGEKRALLCELFVTYADGSSETYGTDESWEYTEDGPRRLSSFFDGETYDARREDRAAWRFQPAALYHGFAPETVCACGVAVRREETLSPVFFQKTEDGCVAGFAKNAAGVLELKAISGKAGQTISVTHGEILADGEVYTKNLRTAKATLSYTCRDGVQSYSPLFTYMGFQYVRVSGADVGPENLLFHVLSSDNETVGSFACSDERLNTLMENIQTSETANFLEIPTDCPQRDERCGWTGDIAVFAETACFFRNANAFLRKWLCDVRLNQTHRGVIPMFVPDGMFGRKKKDGPYALIHRLDDAVWGDCIVLVPWAVYEATGDESILSENYEAMKAWIAYEKRQAAKFSLGRRRYIWSWGFHFGDWLAPGESILKNMAKAKWTSTAYFAHSADLLSRIADILGKTEDAENYRTLFQRIRAAFRGTFLNKKGEIKKGFQSAYALAISFGLLNEEETKRNGELLAADIRAHGNHLTTGFAGTPQLLPALSQSGQADAAMALLSEETCPGWLYPVARGATSVWERWDALREDGSVNTSDVGGDSMVSFNHYAYGAVGAWMVRTIAGLAPAAPGYKEVWIRPFPGHGISAASASHRSPYGLVSAAWEQKDGILSVRVTLPFGTTGRVVLPGGEEIPLGSGTHVLSRETDKGIQA